METVSRNEFLSKWFEDCEGVIEIRILPSGQQRFSPLDDYEGIDHFAKEQKGEQGVYFGLATRNGKGGTKAHLIDAPGAWADIDFPSPTRRGMPKEKADKLLKECPLQPTFIIDSGNGYQTYWKFKEPTQNIEIVQYINRQLREYFGSDNVCNADRVLRLPDTINHKYNPWRPVKVLAFNKAKLYDQSDFEEHFLPPGDVNEVGQPENPLGWQDEALKGVEEGQRNTIAAKLAGRCLAKKLSVEETLTYLKGWNQKNKPPLDEGELKQIIGSVAKTDTRNHPPQEDPLKFPNIMSGVARDFAKLYSANLEVPEPFLYMAFLGCLGAILSKSLKLNTELDIETRLYLLLLGESADERKSTALKKTVQFFKELLKEDLYVCWGVNSAEGLQKMLKKNSTLLLAIDELKALLNKCRIETSTLLPMITTLFESDTFEAHTKTSDILVDDASLSLLAASTIDTYETVWHPSFTAIGFSNRLWIVPGAAKKEFSFPTKIPENARDTVKSKTIHILKFVGDGLELDISPEGREIFHSWYLGLEQSVHTKRLDGYALRFMALLAANDLKDKIDTETVKKVIELCNWQLKVRQLYDPIDADTAVARMEERVRRYLRQGPLTERQIKRKLHRVITQSGVWCFTSAMKNLRVAKEIYSKGEGKTVFVHLSE